MKIMNYFLTLVLCAVSLTFLTAASVAPEVVETAPPVEKKATSKKEVRKAAKLERLQKRYDRVTSAKAKTRIQHKINQVNESKEATTLEILALVFAFLFPLVGLILAIMARKQGGGTLANVAFWLSLIFLILAIVGIVLVIITTIAAASAIGSTI